MASSAHYDDDAPTPGVVTGAVSIGTAPLPFLAVYTALFLLHGTIHPVHPPDIGSGQRDEVIAGTVTAVAFIVLSIALHAVPEPPPPLAVRDPRARRVAGGVDVAVDNTRGGSAIGLLLAAAALVVARAGLRAGELGAHRRQCPPGSCGPYTAVGLGVRHEEHEPTIALPTSGEPTRTRPSVLRRSRTTD